jgi:AraC-like DNA-binding protein
MGAASLPAGDLTAPPLDVQRHETTAGCWEMVRRPPHPALRELVHGSYCGWREDLAPGFVRRELPSTRVPLIFAFAGSYRVGGPGQDVARGAVHGSFAAGLWDGFADTQASGPTSGVQVDLTPLGAFRLLRAAPAELAGRCVPLADVLGGSGFITRLAEAASWQRRFALVDAELLSRLQAAPAVPPAVAWAWRRLAASAGVAEIRALAAAAGWSHKHLIARFRDHVGLAPKRVGRILRFERFSERLAAARRPCWPALALDCGYYDQAHLARDCRAFAGCAPGALLARRLPGGGWAGG